MKILVSDVIEDIYSLTAMSTVVEEAECPLLHPGHRQALVRTVRDSLGIVLAMAPRTLRLIAASDSEYELSLDDRLDPTTAAECLRSALCHVTVWVIRRAGGLTKQPLPDFFITGLTIDEAAAGGSCGCGDSVQGGDGENPGTAPDEEPQEYATAFIRRHYW